MSKKCQICDKNNATTSFYDTAGRMYDLKIINMQFSNICEFCWNDLCDMKSDLTDIAVMYHNNYRYHRNAEEFLLNNNQLVFRNSKSIYVGTRRKEIENLCRTKGDK